MQQQCPDAWALATTDDFRKFSSVLDILPSAVESRGSEDHAMFINHDFLGMLKAMSAHKSQSRWWAALPAHACCMLAPSVHLHANVLSSSCCHTTVPDACRHRRWRHVLLTRYTFSEHAGQNKAAGDGTGRCHYRRQVRWVPLHRDQKNSIRNLTAAKIGARTSMESRHSAGAQKRCLPGQIESPRHAE